MGNLVFTLFTAVTLNRDDTLQGTEKLFEKRLHGDPQLLCKSSQGISARQSKGTVGILAASGITSGNRNGGGTSGQESDSDERELHLELID